MHIIKRLVQFFVVALIVGSLVALLGLQIYAGRVLRTLDGVYSHPSLKDRVVVTRDDWGVPHINARHATDAYFAYGFTVAQDRLFQLEILRRLGQGELAEILGPVALPLDKVARTLMWRKTAEKLLADESRFDPGFIASMDAFIEGLNFSVESQPWPIEFDILGIEPRPFTKVDSLSLFGYMSYGFAEGMSSDATYAITKARNPGLDVGLLFPGYSKQSPVTVIEGTDAKFVKAATGPSDLVSTEVSAEGLEQLAMLLKEVESALDIFGGFEGSNSWVLGPSRTKSGEAILANDPHIGFTNPAVWYECHVKYDGYESYGVHLPLIPFPIIGHNRDRAWAMTMLENDDLDLYRETFAPEDSSQVMYRGKWVEAEQWTETVKVKGAEDVELSITVTPHGPVVTEMLSGYEGPPVSVWWMFHHMAPESLQALYKVGMARNIKEMQAAVAMIEAPGLNISYADSGGTIAWWAAAKLPIRPAHVNSKDILDGSSGRDEIVGFLDFKDNPQLINPPSGVIVTSNNLPTTQAVGPIAELQGYWQPSDRAGRVLDLLAQEEKWDLEGLRKVQCDTLLRSASPITASLVAVLEKQSAALDGVEAEALAALKAWDYVHSVDSVGATIYQYLYDSVREHVAKDEIGEASFSSYLKCADSRNMMSYVVHDEASPLWDNVATQQRETREEIVLAAFKTAVSRLRADLGDVVAVWTWGTVHTVEYGHIIGNVKPLDRLWNIGPFPAPGTAESIAKMQWIGDGYEVAHGASMRLLIDYATYGKENGTWFILPTGNSGDVMSGHFDDQADMYLRGEYRSLRIEDDDVERHKKHKMHLTPAGM